MRLLRLWFSLGDRVTRRQYVLSGLFLMALKYGLDAGALQLGEGVWLHPIDFLSPIFKTREALLGRAHEGLLAAMVLWALPFLWIGVSMSIRRAVDAGWSPWLGLLFVLPFVNMIVIGALALAPSSPHRRWELSGRTDPSSEDRVKSALIGVVAGVALAGSMVAVSVLLLKDYGWALFFATPFFIGAVAAYVYNANRPRTVSSSVGVGVVAVLAGCGALLLFALEGVFCIAMATPIAMVPAILGALVGRAIAVRKGGAAGLLPLLLALPLTTAMSASAPTPLTEREVVSAIEIDAPPASVWPHVIGFTELPPPPEVVFNLGIAYPMRAVIEGEGVGAVRRCEFSTGPFVEPITRWEPPTRLSFDVRSQPPPMFEWSPYRHVHPPHLDGYLRSRRGEFRLIALPGGRTRLEGSTWYTLDLAPSRYWALWSDALIHQIHMRVLRHIASLSER